jgi:drug/metabolite transporter (DMT)-like permease
VFYGWIRYLIATDRGGVIWGMVFVLAVAIFTGSDTATAIAAVLVVAALLALWRLNRVPRPRSPASDAGVRPIYLAAGFCAVLGAVFYKVGAFDYGIGVVIFVLIAYVAISVSRPRRS